MTAVLFQSMPPLSPEEYQALEASIREHGVQVPILVDESGVVIDGHHRKAIAEALGIHCPRKAALDLTDQQKRTLALTLNLDRRHLTREQKRAIVEASVKADPELSDREHARRTGVSHPTVAAVRADLVNRGDVEELSTRADSLGRQQPAMKPAPEPYHPFDGEAVVAEAIAKATTPPFDPRTGEVLDGEPALADAPGRVVKLTGPGSVSDPRPVTGLDGKTYSRPAADTKPRRSPLPDSFWRATYDLTKKVESLTRLVDDDRFPQNAEKVATANRSDLVRAIDALQRVVDRLDRA